MLPKSILLYIFHLLANTPYYTNFVMYIVMYIRKACVIINNLIVYRGSVGVAVNIYQDQHLWLVIFIICIF